MKNKCKILVLFGIIVCNFFFVSRIQGNVFDINQSSSGYYVDGTTLTPLSSQTNIPYGANVQLHFNVTNLPDNQITAKFERTYGMEYLAYYSGVLQIDGRVVSQQEYSQFISSTGASITCANQQTTIILTVKSVGSTQGKITGSLSITVPNDSSSVKTQKLEHAFYGNYAFPKEHNVQFYHEGTLLSNQNVIDGSTPMIPSLSDTDGYTFVGFNTQKDGSGSFYQNDAIHESVNLYAIFQKVQYTVNYYVDGELFHSEQVYYMESPKSITPDKEEGRTFLKWDRSLETITSNVDVYAIFESEDEEEIKNNLRFRITDKQYGEEATITEKNHVIHVSDVISNPDLEIKEITITREETQISLFPLLCIGGIIIIYIIWRKA
ncbi:InlB B-repeat-containing protein [Breznakia pachnodae]|uniref:Cohesin domain-containing protein n=1 Tax=Breznakia pachnodae TaxID=265178 RepID=A0ABU0E5K3_9FIRM|nr:InlB B-repeat-containing protein [Breznakia pachnodae]MDQ0361790.1 hypothetical protein [Breznakia pachnodae]